MTTSKGITASQANRMLGIWLQGKRLDDMRYIDPGDLPAEYAHYYRMIRAGKTVLDLIEEEPDRKAWFRNTITDSSEVLYELALKDAIKQTAAEAYVSGKINAEELNRRIQIATADDIVVPDLVQPSDVYGLLEQLNAPNRAIKLPYMPVLTDWTGGLEPGTMTTIAARTGCGKSTVSTQLSWRAAENGERVLFVTTELLLTQVQGRILALDEYADRNELRKKQVTDVRRLSLGLDEIHAAVTDKRLMIASEIYGIEAIEMLVHKHKPTLIIVDQLSKLTTQKTFYSIREQYVYLSDKLKKLAVKADAPLVICAQLNRDQDEYREPTLADLSESASIANDSDAVLMLWPDKDGDGDRRLRDICIKCAKAREGETGIVKATFDVARSKIYEKDIF